MPQRVQKSQHDEGPLLPGLRQKLQLSSMRLRVQTKVLTEETPLLETLLPKHVELAFETNWWWFFSRVGLSISMSQLSKKLQTPAPPQKPPQI